MTQNVTNTISTYAENALLTRLSKSEWTGKKKASEIDTQIAAENNAQKGRATKTDKILVAKDEPLWRAVKSAGRAVHTEWERWSCPWQDGGTRMIASSRFMEFSKRLEDAISKFDAAVSAFLNDYLDMIPRQAKRLGNLFDERDYPSLDEMRQKFAVSVDYQPVPTADDFRCQLADDQLEAVRQSTHEGPDQAAPQGALDHGEDARPDGQDLPRLADHERPRTRWDDPSAQHRERPEARRTHGRDPAGASHD